MKNVFKIMVVLLFLFPFKSKAQFLKKLQKAVTESVENAAVDQTANSAANKTAEVIDGSVNKASDAIVGLFSKKKRRKKKRNKKEEQYSDEESGYDSDNQEMDIALNEVDPSSLPDQYNFSWQYSMQMQSEGKTFNLDYYLQPDADYFGAKPDIKASKSVGNIIMIMDVVNNTNVIFMDMNGKKMAMPSSVSVDTEFDSEAVENSNNFTFKEIGTKKILGFTCQGYKMENDDTSSIIYVTKDAPVSFTQLFKATKNKTPKGFNSNWLDQLDNSLVMEMEFTDKTNNTTTSMKCIALNQKEVTINTGDYQFMNIKIPSLEK